VARVQLRMTPNGAADLSEFCAGWYPIQDLATTADGDLIVDVGGGSNCGNHLHVHSLPAQRHLKLQWPRPDEWGTPRALCRCDVAAL
jgi:hypothetical protein